MNSTNINIGSWEGSKTRNLVNDTIYNFFPLDLKTAIKETKVISSHGNSDTKKFITKDKMYLLSTIEVGLPTPSDTSKSNTRTLDFYKEKGNTSRIKNLNGTANN